MPARAFLQFDTRRASRRVDCRAVPIILVKVKPNARASSLVEIGLGSWSAELKSPPVDGKANQELIGLVARQFGRRRSAVTIRSGAGGRLKRVQIED